MRRIVTALAAFLCLAGCGPQLTEGKVVGREYDDPDYWTTEEYYWRDPKTYLCYGYETVHHRDDAHYYLVLEDYVDNKLVRDSVEVTEHDYNRCRHGWVYPVCEPR